MFSRNTQKQVNYVKIRKGDIKLARISATGGCFGLPLWPRPAGALSQNKAPKVLIKPNSVPTSEKKTYFLSSPNRSCTKPGLPRDRRRHLAPLTSDQAGGIHPVPPDEGPDFCRRTGPSGSTKYIVTRVLVMMYSSRLSARARVCEAMAGGAFFNRSERDESSS